MTTTTRQDIAVGDVFYPRDPANARHTHKRVLALIDQHATWQAHRKVVCSCGGANDNAKHIVVCSERALLRWGKRRDVSTGAPHGAPAP